MNGFDWSRDDGAVVVQQPEAIAVFMDEKGDIVVRQKQWPDEDVYVVIPFASARDICAAILKQVQDAGREGTGG
jgi:hypothetical protein